MTVEEKIEALEVVSVLGLTAALRGEAVLVYAPGRPGIVGGIVAVSGGFSLIDDNFLADPVSYRYRCAAATAVAACKGCYANPI